MHPALAAARRTLLVDRRPLGRDELTTLAGIPEADVPALLELAADVRDAYCGARAYVEVIYNAKKGGCSEDCHFCSQSARFATDVDPEPLKTVDDFVGAARDALARGAGEFCIVVAVRGPSNALLMRVAAAVREIKATMPLEVAVSLGILTDAQLAVLVEAGVDKVNHNLESSRRFFPFVCTTHTLRRALRNVPARQARRARTVLRRHHRHGRNDRRSHRFSLRAARTRARRSADQFPRSASGNAVRRTFGHGADGGANVRRARSARATERA